MLQDEFPGEIWLLRRDLSARSQILPGNEQIPVYPSAALATPSLPNGNYEVLHHFRDLFASCGSALEFYGINDCPSSHFYG